MFVDHGRQLLDDLLGVDVVPGESSFVRDLHAGAATPRDVLDAVVRRATGESVAGLVRIARGYDNEVYRIRTSGGREVAVRIRRFGGRDRGSEQEAWAVEQARRAGVPVPETLLFDTIRTDGPDLPVMVQAWLPGWPLARVAHSLSPSELRGVLVEVGVLLARLNSVAVQGFWWPEVDGGWDRPGWDRVMGGYVANRRAERERIVAAGFSDPEFELMIGMLEQYVREFPCDEPVLCHGDLHTEHIFVDDELRITGVIDFGDWTGGPPVHDLAYLRYTQPHLDLDPVLEGYGSPDRTDRSYLTRLELHSLALAMAHLASETDDGNWAAARHSAHSLRGLLWSLDHRSRAGYRDRPGRSR